MSFQDAIIWPGAIIALFMAYTIGANDLANALGTSVGSKALSITTAVILAGVAEFAGVMLLGRLVSGLNKTPKNRQPPFYNLSQFKIQKSPIILI